MESTHLEVGGLRVSVAVEGVTVPQYGVQTDPGAREVTSWIVSQPDTRFAINANLTHRRPGEMYAVRVFLDGHMARGLFLKPSQSTSLRISAARISHTETREFMFGSLELSDDDALLESSAAQKIGEIKVVLYRVGTHVPSHGSYKEMPEVQKVHERAKKGLVHSVKYGESQINPVRGTCLMANTTVLATHTIRYRPLAMLQAMEIAPYTPYNSQPLAGASTARVSPSSKLSLNPSKNRKIIAHVDVKPDIIFIDDDDFVKKENDSSNTRRQEEGQPTKRIKREAMKPIIPGEVLDLTM